MNHTDEVNKAREALAALDVGSTLVSLGGEEVDLALIPPFTLGIKRRLWREAKVDLGRLREFTPDEEAAFVLFCLRLVRPQTTEQEAESLPMEAVSRLAIIAFRRMVGVGAPRPTSMQSPSSPGGGAGGQGT